MSLVSNGELAGCMWTDPPYGVEYEGGTKAKLTIKNDTADGLNGLLEGAFAVPETGPIGLEGDRGQMEYRRIQIKMP